MRCVLDSESWSVRPRRVYIHIHIYVHIQYTYTYTQHGSHIIYRHHLTIYSYHFVWALGHLSQQPCASYRGTFTCLTRLQALLDASLAWRGCASINTAHHGQSDRAACTYTHTYTYIYTYTYTYTKYHSNI